MDGLPEQRKVPAKRPISASPRVEQPHYHKLKRIFLLVSVTIPLLLWMDHRGSFDELEALALDMTSRLVTRNTGVVIVEINNQDYKTKFQGQSPLKQETLIQLVDTIANAQPKAIGIDIVTDPAVWSKIAPHPGIPIVWAYRPDDPENKSLTPLDGSWGSPKWSISGHAARQYIRLVPCKVNHCPSLAWQMMKKAYPDSGLEDSSEELTIRFVPHQNQNLYPASEILGMADSNRHWGKEGSVLWNKIVLLGGTYDDKHETPLGPMSGVEIWANILETEIDGGGYRSPPWFVLLILGLFESVLLVWLLQVWDFKRGLLTSTIAVPFVSVAFSFMVYHNARRWAYFAIILVTLIAEECIEVAREQRSEQIEEFLSELRKRPHHASTKDAKGRKH